MIFAIQPLLYILGTVAAPILIPKWVEIRITLITASLFLGLCYLLIGPVYEDVNLTVMLIGLTISGFMMGLQIIPNMAEMMYATKLKYPMCDLDYANSLLSGLFNCCFAIGQGMGPLIGSAIYQVSNFRVMCDVVAVVVCSFAILYFVIAGGVEAISKTCQGYRDRKKDPRYASV